MGTKENPGAFDCYSRAEPNEPMFVLLGRDPATTILVDAWIALRADGDPAKLEEAKACADAAYTWLMNSEKRGEWRAVKDRWLKLSDAFPRSDRLNFDLVIGRLDHVLSQLIGFAKAKDKSRDDADKQTLKHHAEDMIMAGEKILSELMPSYTCEHCFVTSPKDAWGPGHVRCPKCKRVAQSPAERAS